MVKTVMVKLATDKNCKPLAYISNSGNSVFQKDENGINSIDKAM